MKFAALLMASHLFIANGNAQETGLKQKEPGIHFQHNLSWDQALLRAKQLHKYIVVDFYATWCKPCKLMEKNVFSVKSVADFYNLNFVSLSVQVDTSLNDNDDIKRSYKLAAELSRKYDIQALPTFLFFNEKGKLVHKAVGYYDSTEFNMAGQNAMEPCKQYYTLLRKYRNGKKDFNEILYIAELSKDFKDNKLADQIAEDYIRNYLNKKSLAEILAPQTFRITSEFYSLLRSTDKVFEIFYTHPDQVDSIVKQKGYSQSYVDYIILKEEFEPIRQIAIKNNTTPDWAAFSNKVGKKYDEATSERIALNAKLMWYFPRDKKTYAMYSFEKIEKFGLDTSGMGRALLNNLAWDLFLNSTDQLILNKAITYMETLVALQPDVTGTIDTYANLLYKVGRISEAVSWEEKVVKLDEANTAKGEKPNNSDYHLQTLDKMKKGIPTWDKDYSPTANK